MEIKFKVNNGFERNHICEAATKDNDEGTLYSYWDDKENDWLFCRDVRQYTGVKDSKGIEIYLSDLIKDEKGNVLEVIFESGCFGFKKIRRISFCSEETTENFYPIYEYEQSGEDFFVVGNIYENPELLKRP